jgi:hypothetical protein
MRSEAGAFDRPWVLPDVCSTVGGVPQAASDLRAAIDRAERALEVRSLGRLVHALVAVRAALRSRATQRDAEHDGCFAGPWKRRLQRRYAASMCAIERLLETVWAYCDFDSIGPEARDELAKLHRLESLEDAAYIDRYWTDLGIGD